jgi:hypothetical protein
MNRVTDGQLPTRERLHRWASEFVIARAKFLPSLGCCHLNMIRHFARHLRVSEIERTGKPRDVDVELVCITKCVMFMAEDSDATEAGLAALLRIFGTARTRRDSGAAAKWFHQERGRQAGSSWKRLGDLQFGAKRGNLVKGGVINVAHVSPSVYCLTLQLFLTNWGRSRYQSLIASDARPIIKVHWSWRNVGVTRFGPERRREEELATLNDQIDDEVKRRLRPYLAHLIPRRGRVPTINLLLLAQGSREPGVADAFWRSMGVGAAYVSYSDTGLSIFSDAVSSQAEPLVVLANGPQILTPDHLTMCGGDQTNALMVYAGDALEGLGVLRAFEGHARNISDRLVALRDHIGGLATRGRSSRWFGRRESSSLTRLEFEHARMAAENPVSHLGAYVRPDLVGFVSDLRPRENQATYVDDRLFLLDDLRHRIGSQLDVHSRTYRRLSDERLATLMLILAIVGAIVGLGEFVPEPVQESLFHWITAGVFKPQ